MLGRKSSLQWAQNIVTDQPVTVTLPSGETVTVTDAAQAEKLKALGLSTWQGENWKGQPGETPSIITKAQIASEEKVLQESGFGIDAETGEVKSLNDLSKNGTLKVTVVEDESGEDGENGGVDDGTGDGTGTTTKKSGAETFNEGVQGFADGITKMGGGIAMLATAAGNSDKAAKVMEIAAKVQMAAAIVEQTTAALKAATGDNPIFSFFKAFLGFGRYGGVFSASGKSFSGGGVATGPESGYGAVLHGTEAVVPLGNDRSIPVKGNVGGNTNTTINVNMAEGSSDTTSDAESGKQLAIAINAAVQKEIEVQQRPGGLIPGGG